MNKIIITAVAAALALGAFAKEHGRMRANPDAKLQRGEGNVAVKGGAFDSKRTECRTETRAESRKASAGYPNVTFRIVREER